MAYFVDVFSLAALTFQLLSPTVIFVVISCDNNLGVDSNKITNIILHSH